MTDEDPLLLALADLSDDEIERLVLDLPPDYAEYLATALQRTEPVEPLAEWSPLPHQIPPEGDWAGWVLSGGRGVGKTMTGARLLADHARSIPGLRARVIAPTLSDAVNGVVLDPDSGILAADSTAQFKPSGVEGARVEWPNGSKLFLVGTPSLKDVDRLRALTNIDFDLFEEAAANTQLTAAAEQAALSRRGKRLPHPRWAATSTPRPVPTFKAWLKDPKVAVTRATTHDNPHTPDAYREYAESIRGTRLYRQEILGEVVEDIEGALWTMADLDRGTVPYDERQDLIATLTKIVVGVDPPSGSGTCGIVVVGRDEEGKLYVLDDYSVTDSTPIQWAMSALQAARDYGAEIVAETNQGGRMVKETLIQAQKGEEGSPIPLAFVAAAVGKKTRAEPISILWEAEDQLAHLAPESVGALSKLIVELTEWVPGVSASPDRLDAMVWACHRLLTGGKATLHKANPRGSRRGSAPSLRSAMQGGLGAG